MLSRRGTGLYTRRETFLDRWKSRAGRHLLLEDRMLIRSPALKLGSKRDSMMVFAFGL